MNRALTDSHRKGRRFYVDATGGNNANTGRSPSAAWQTIGKLNGVTFNPGDRILLKAGETWTGTQFTIPSNGVTISKYGVGADPIIDGNDATNCIYAQDKDFIRLKDLDLTQGVDFGAQLVRCENVFVISCSMHDAGNDNLCFIDTCKNGKVQGGTYYNGYSRLADGRAVSGIEIADSCDDMVIDGAECYDNHDARLTSGHGLTIHSHAVKGMPNRVTIKNCNSHDNDGYGIQVLKMDDTDDDGDQIIIEDNILESNEDGFRIYKDAGAANYPSGVILRGNQAYDNTTYWGYLGGDKMEVYQNEFQGRGLIHSAVDLNFYNNTLYLTEGAWHYCVFILNARVDGLVMKNNIFSGWLATDMPIGLENTVITTPDIDYNLHYSDTDGAAANRWDWLGVKKNFATWKTDSGMDAHSVYGDPAFVDAANEDFTLGGASPAIDIGIDMGLEYLGDAPDAGANEKS